MWRSRHTLHPETGDRAASGRSEDELRVAVPQHTGHPEPQEGDFWLQDEILVQPRLNRLVRSGQPVALRPRALRILEVLAEHPGRVISKDELLERVWVDVSVSEDTLYRTVSTLREALGDQLKEPRILATVHKVGYRLLGQVRFAEPPPKDDLLRQPGESADARAPGSARPFARTLPLMALALLLAPLPGGRHRSDHAGSGLFPTASPGRPLVSLLDAELTRKSELLAGGGGSPKIYVDLAERLLALGRPLDARELLDASAVQPENLAQPTLEVARFLRARAEMSLWLGSTDQAIRNARRAEAILRELPGIDPRERAAAESLLGDVLADRGDPEGVDWSRAALNRLRDTVGESDPSTAEQLCQVGWAHLRVGDPFSAELLTRQCLAELERLIGPDRVASADALNRLAAIRWRRGDPEGAREAGSRALQRMIEALGDDRSAHVSIMLSGIGMADLELGEPRAAEARLRKAFELSSSLVGPDALTTSSMELALAVALERDDRLDEAHRHLEHVLSIRRSLTSEDSVDLSQPLLQLASVLRRSGHPEAALDAASRSLSIRRHHLGDDNLQTADSRLEFAEVLLALGRRDEATPLFEAALAVQERHLGSRAPAVSRTRERLLDTLRASASNPT